MAEDGDARATMDAIDWRAHIPDDVKADPELAAIAGKMTEKDLPSFIKSRIHQERLLGRAITLPGKGAKPEEITSLRQRLYESGVFTPPPKEPGDYGIVKPENLPDGIAWNDGLAGKLATTLHKHGVPKEAANDLLDLYAEALTGAQKSLKTSFDEGIAALKAEHGDKFDDRMASAKRLGSMIFKTPEELAFFERMGLGNHPAFLSIMMRLAPLAEQDTSFMPEARYPGGQMTGDEARAEAARVMSDKTHPMHEAWARGDRKANEYIDELYKKAYGGGKVEIG